MDKLPKEDREAEFAALLAIFQEFLKSIGNDANQWEVLEELMALRADFAIHHAIKGFGIEWDDALKLLEKDAQELGELERDQAMVIRAAIDNLVDFAVAEEYHLAEEVMEECEDILEDYDGDYDSDDDVLEVLFAINRRYNNIYAGVENEDVIYAMAMAAGWITLRDGVELMYMTQGDERVRPWHLQYEGFTAPKASFPEWLIPPIEHQCRCYLIEFDTKHSLADAQDAIIQMPEMPEWFNKTFKESVAKGGRIFSDEHPYFQVAPESIDTLKDISSRIKAKYIK